MAPKLTVDGTKYTFFVPEGDYRPHIHRHGEPWVVVDRGCNAVLALMYEAERARDAIMKIEGALLTIGACPPSSIFTVIREALDAFKRGE